MAPKTTKKGRGETAIDKDEPARVDVMPLPVPGQKTKKRSAIAGPVQPQWKTEAIPILIPKGRKPPKKGTARVQIRTEVIPMPIPKGKKPPKKGTAQPQWITEAIPMPIPPGRKPPRARKKK